MDLGNFLERMQKQYQPKDEFHGRIAEGLERYAKTNPSEEAAQSLLAQAEFWYQSHTEINRFNREIDELQQQADAETKPAEKIKYLTAVLQRQLAKVECSTRLLEMNAAFIERLAAGVQS